MTRLDSLGRDTGIGIIRCSIWRQVVLRDTALGTRPECSTADRRYAAPFGAPGIDPELAVLRIVGSFRKPNLAVTIDRVATLESMTLDRSVIRVKAMKSASFG